MINVDGKEFKTLRDLIRVNGRTVKEVWANNSLVYPEGNLIKVKCFVDKTYKHIHLPDIIPVADDPQFWSGYFGPSVSTFSIKCVAVMIYHTIPGKSSKKSTIDRPPNDVRYFYGDAYHDIVHHNGIVAPTPHFSEPEYMRKGLPSIGLPVEEKYGIIDCKAKYEMSPTPICGPLQLPLYSQKIRDVSLYDNIDLEGHHGVTWFDNGETYYGSGIYYTHKFTPIRNSIVGPAEFNDKVFALFPNFDKGELSIRTRSQEYPTGIVEIGYRGNGINIYIDEYTFPINVKRIEGDPEQTDMTTTDLGTYYGWTHHICQVPITDILYAGDMEDAPPEALTISDDELNLD